MSTIFERYGGFGTVSKIVMAFYDKVLESDVAGPYFEDVDMRSLIDHQTRFVAQVMGGPAEYSNDMLQAVHARHRIDRAAFDEVVMLLKETLEDFGVDSGDVRTIVDDVKSRAAYIVTV